MLGWLATRPRRCLKIGTDGLAWAETERTWRGRRRHRCLTAAIPDGAVKASPAEPNIGDRSVVEARIRSLAGPPPSLRVGGHVLGDVPRPIVLVLPDAAVRTVVLSLDQLPTRAEEREALVRWRLGQEQLFPVSGAKVVFQHFAGGREHGANPPTVLAIAVQESVLEQYESVCETAGLIPWEVGITSLHLFDLWRHVSGPGWQRRGVLWINLADNALTTMVFQHGRLLFYRCKLLSGEAHSTAGASLLNRIVEESAASLDACLQRHPDVHVKDAIVCVPGDLTELEGRIVSDLDLSTQLLGWSSVEKLGWVSGSKAGSVASLAAVAGVC